MDIKIMDMSFFNNAVKSGALSKYVGGGKSPTGLKTATGYTAVTPSWVNNRAQPSANNYSGYAGGYSTGGGGAAAAPAYSQEDMAYLDDQSDNLNRQLGRTDTTLANALARIVNDYNKQVSSTNKARGRAIEDFNTKRQINEHGRAREIGKVDTNARMLADSLRQRLGLAGGSGSSAYQLAAPKAVQRQASDQRTDVLEDYSQNFLALDRDETRALEDFKALLADLANQRREREGGVRGDIEETRNDIRSKLARIAGEKQKLRGGGYNNVREAMRPYEDDIRRGEKVIDSIFNKYTAKYKVNPVKVRNTQLRDYMTDKVAVRDNAATGEENEYAPYKTYLDQDDDEEIL